jgi:hypothetical protein
MRAPAGIVSSGLESWNSSRPHAHCTVPRPHASSPLGARDMVMFRVAWASCTGEPRGYEERLKQPPDPAENELRRRRRRQT